MNILIWMPTSRDVLGDHAAAILVLFHQAHLLESHWVTGALVVPVGRKILDGCSFTQHPSHESCDIPVHYTSHYATHNSIARLGHISSEIYPCLNHNQDIVNEFLDVMINLITFEN